ncbi:MAG: alpha/beta fold hydrolase [Polyangiales bacterium]
MNSRTVDLEGSQLHYVEYGGPEDGTPMVLVHGLGGSHVNWNAVAPSLARKHRVIALDLPGFGRSPPRRQSAPLDENADLIARFLEKVSGAPAVLVGNSMGGLLSMMVASRAPKSVRSLVLVDAALPPARGVKLDREVAMVFAMYMVPRLGEWVMRNRAAKMTPEQLVHDTMRVCCAEPEKLAREIITAHVAMAEERQAMAWAHQAFLHSARAIVRAVLIPGKLQRIADRVQAPVLVLHGDRDRLVPLGAARAASERRKWKLVVFENVGHVPQLEIPERFVSTLEHWL